MDFTDIKEAAAVGDALKLTQLLEVYDCVFPNAFSY
jgi:hypothetical protein